MSLSLPPALWRKVQGLGLQRLYKEDDPFRSFINCLIALAFIPPTFLRVGWRGLKGDAPTFSNCEEFFTYFEATWINGNYPVRLWNVHAMDGPRTNNNAEGWHSKVRKIAGKAHPNIYEAVSLFKSEQAATEVSLIQLAAGGLPVRRRRKYRNHEKRLTTIKEKYEAGDYSLSELIQAYSNWASF